jgi:hypothetical protein
LIEVITKGAQLMVKRDNLLYQVRDKLTFGAEFAEFMDFATEAPEWNLLAKELDSARRWISEVVDQPEPQVSEKMSDLTALLRTCGRLTKDQEYPFLAADFEKLADDARSLYPPLRA